MAEQTSTRRRSPSRSRRRRRSYSRSSYSSYTSYSSYSSRTRSSSRSRSRSPAPKRARSPSKSLSPYSKRVLLTKNSGISSIKKDTAPKPIRRSSPKKKSFSPKRVARKKSYSPPRKRRSRSYSSFSSRSLSSRGRSPTSKKTSVAPRKGRSPSPPPRKTTVAPRKGGSPSSKKRVYSPKRVRSPSPRRRRSPTPRRGRSPSPRKRKSTSPRKRAPSPRRGRSPTPRNPVLSNSSKLFVAPKQSRETEDQRVLSIERNSTVVVSKERSPSPIPPKILVTKLTRNVNVDHMNEIFKYYGNIKLVDLPMNEKLNRNKGLAYVTFSSLEEAKEAVEHMNNAYIDGVQVGCALYAPPKPVFKKTTTVVTAQLKNKRDPVPRGGNGYQKDTIRRPSAQTMKDIAVQLHTLLTHQDLLILQEAVVEATVDENKGSKVRLTNMKYVLRRATKANASNNPIKPRPRTGVIPFEIRGVSVESGGPAKLIETLKTAGLGKLLFPSTAKKSVSMNGLKAFVPSINKLVFHYNLESRRSDLLMSYVQNVLPSFAKSHPYIEIAVMPTTRVNGEVSAMYNNGKIKQIDATQFDFKGIIRAIEELAYQKGGEPKRIKCPVASYTKDVLINTNPFQNDNIFT